MALMKFDLHVHSSESFDSFSSLSDIIRFAKKRQLNGIAVTDHGAFSTRDLRGITAAHGIWIIKGSEVQTEIGDILGLFICKRLESKKALALIDEIHAQRGIAILAHPFKRQVDYPHDVLEKIDGVEVANARWKDLSLLENQASVNYLLSRVAGRSAGSDAHFSFEVGRAYWVTHPLRYMEELKESLIAGNGWAMCDHFSGGLDRVTQFVKVLKNPSIGQLARALCWRLRQRKLTSG